MDNLAISPEELAQVIGSIGSDPQPQPSKPRQSPMVSPPADAFSGNPGSGALPMDLASMAEPPPAREPEKKAYSNVTAHPVQFAPLESPSGGGQPSNLDLLLGVTLQVTVELGRTKMNIEEILHLGPGSVVELEKLAGEPVDVLINDKMIARGEVVVLDDRFGVRITDVLPPAQRINSLR
ncbi:MAG: hypothetical protein Kow0031_17540 [Anaerolineae bacterium]